MTKRQYRSKITILKCAVCSSPIPMSKSVRPHEYLKRVTCSRKCFVARSGPSIEQRIANSITVDAVTGCWVWTKCRDRKGYGRLSAYYHGEVLAHRVSYIARYGAILNGAHVLHRCDNPSCVNPEHLFLGCNLDNVSDRVAKGRSRGAAGTANCKAKLTEDQVAAIRISAGPQAKIAERYGISQTSVSLIKLRRTWRHV